MSFVGCSKSNTDMSMKLGRWQQHESNADMAIFSGAGILAAQSWWVLQRQ